MAYHASRRARMLALALAAFLLGGCATLPENTQRSEKDPWERYNRAVYRFNDTLDRNLLRPVAKGYRKITPDPVERGISNFFTNLSYPVIILNQFLQGDIREGTSDIGRFLFNTVIGVGGIFDPATSIGLEHHSEDFGQTLAVWGVPEGPFVVLPFLGPSTARDTVGTYADIQVNPLFEAIDEPEKYYALGLRLIDMRAQLLDLDSQLQRTYDPYAFLRDAYLQRREYLVHDGNLPQEQSYYDDLYEGMEDFEDFEDYEEEAPPPENGNDAENNGSEPADGDSKDGGSQEPELQPAESS